MAELKPFHETIVSALNKCVHLMELNTLLDLLETTKIPKNHEAIINMLTIRADEITRIHSQMTGERASELYKRVENIFNLLKEQQAEVVKS